METRILKVKIINCLKSLLLAIVVLISVLPTNGLKNKVLSKNRTLDGRYPILTYCNNLLVETRVIKFTNPESDEFTTDLQESNLELLDLTTLKSVWTLERNQLRNDVETGKIQLANGFVLHENFLLVRNKGITCYNMDDGERLWHNKTLKELPEYNSINDNNMAYIVRDDGDKYYPRKLIELDIRNGYVVNQFDLKELIFLTFLPPISTDYIINVTNRYVLFYISDTMYNLDLSIGKIIKRIKEPLFLNTKKSASVYNNILVFNNVDFNYKCDTSTRRLKAIDLANGKEIWSQESWDAFICIGNLVYYQERNVCDGNKQVFLCCKDISNGNVLYKTQIDSFAIMDISDSRIILEYNSFIDIFDNKLKEHRRKPIIGDLVFYENSLRISKEVISNKKDNTITTVFTTYIEEL